jgi:hypothetical protein
MVWEERRGETEDGSEMRSSGKERAAVLVLCGGIWVRYPIPIGDAVVERKEAKGRVLTVDSLTTGWVE